MLAARHQPRRQDTLELREHAGHDAQYQQEQIHNGQQYQQHYASDEEHSILEDDSGDEQYIEDEDDNSSSLSIPSESIDFDLVYSIQTFVATVEGQANVVKGDSLFLMDDSNSYWWLVRVLKTQEVGYIPAENIETPFERLARLNKHRNVDLAAATQAERQEDVRGARERMRAAMARTTSPYNQDRKSVVFTGSFMVHQYPAFLWGHEGEEHETSDEEGYESYEEEEQEEGGPEGMEPDDGMEWEENAAQEAQARAQASAAAQEAEARAQAQAQAQRASPASQQAQLGLGNAPSVRSQSSRERLAGNQQDGQQQTQANGSGRNYIDPLEATGTRQISVTPDVARDAGGRPQDQSKRSTSPGTVSSVRSSSQQGLQRSASGDSNVSLVSKNSEVKKGSMDSSSIASKLRKNGRGTPDGGEESGGEGGKKEEKEKKKKSGMFSGLFSKKKDKKDKDGKKGISNSPGGDDSSIGRDSQDSGASPSNNGSPAETVQPSFAGRRPQINTSDLRRPAAGKENQQSGQSPRELSAHASKMQQKDLQEQALYQQYLNRSPSSPPDASLSYGLQTAASQGHQLAAGVNNQNAGTGRPFNNRPGSLIITGNTLDGNPVPELNVMRVFAGERLQSEATFKTVLLNTSTTAAELVKQAMQRFRLPHGEDENDYYLTVVKQFEGDEAHLEKDERPLEIFEELVQSAMDMPTVKRSSISSINSNLSIQPAISKLPMNDFTDDSAVKFYLNRRPSSDMDDTHTLRADDSIVDQNNQEMKADDSILSQSSADPVEQALRKLSTPTGRPQLTLNVQSAVAPERFSSPTARFALQVAIYPEDLPDGLVFDPATEAIIPKSSLQTRNAPSTMANPNVSQRIRKKVFVFPKNTTVAEVIEQSLDMFGIQEGVVDGGDEVEDKVIKRRSSARVRYGLSVQPSETQQERELHPSSKVLEAFSRPPAFKQNFRRSVDMRRRSMDSSQILGSADDVQPGDPVFVLRRAVSYRTSTASRRMSAPLDDVALRHLQRESIMSEQSMASEYTSVTESPLSARQKVPSNRDLIAAQRAATRANQKALLTAQTNSQQGVDLLLPGKGTLRSMRSDDQRTRYSYIQPDGETYDISDIIEEELWDVGQKGESADRERRASPSPNKAANGDLLEGVLVKPRDVAEQRLDQVLAKIKGNAAGNLGVTGGQNDQRSSSATSSGLDDRRSPTPRSGSSLARQQQQQQQPSGSRSQTPNYAQQQRGPSPADRTHSQQPSIASMMSDYNTTDVSTPGMKSTTTDRTTPGSANRPPLLMKDDFGFSKMMAVIETGALMKRPPPHPPLHPVDELLFGPSITVDELHPAAKDIFGPLINQLNDVDQQLDLLLQQTFRASV